MLNKVLVVLFADVDFLFPVLVLANNQCPYALANQVVDYPATGNVQIVLDLIVSLLRQSPYPA